MISDTLSDAAHQIREYLKNPATAVCYKDPAIRDYIDTILEQMDTLRARLDAPPVVPPTKSLHDVIGFLRGFEDDPQQEGIHQMIDAASRAIATMEIQDGVLVQAANLIKTARQYFPKSMHHADKFQLEQTCASINSALAREETKS